MSVALYQLSHLTYLLLIVIIADTYALLRSVTPSYHCGGVVYRNSFLRAKCLRCFLLRLFALGNSWTIEVVFFSSRTPEEKRKEKEKERKKRAGESPRQMRRELESRRSTRRPRVTRTGHKIKVDHKGALYWIKQLRIERKDNLMMKSLRSEVNSTQLSDLFDVIEIV